MKTGGKWMKLSAFVTALVMFLALVLAAIPFYASKPAMAGTVAGKTFSDNFDGKGIDRDKWVTQGEGVGQSVLAGSLKMKGMAAGSSVITKSKVGTAGKDLLVQFDILDYAGQGIMMIVKGMAAQAVSETDMNDSYMQLGTDVRSMRGDSVAFDDYLNKGAWIGNNSWGSVGMIAGYTYLMNFKADGAFSLKIKTIGAAEDKYEEVIKSSATKFSNVGNGYFGFYFAGATPLFEIDNLVIKDGDGKQTFADDFEKEGLDGEKWVASAPVACGPAYDIAFTNKSGGDLLADGSYLITKDALFEFKTENVAAVMQYQLTISEIKEAAFVNYFGLNEAKVGDNLFKIALYETTKTVEEKPVSVLMAAAYLGKEKVGTAVEVGKTADYTEAINVRFDITNNTADQNVAMSLNGKTVVSYNYRLLNGRIAFGIEPYAYKDGEADKTGAIVANMDNLNVEFVDYTVSPAKNLINDFSSADLGEDWYFTNIGTGGSEENPNPDGYGAFIRNGKLEFNNASDGTYFEPIQQYSNFDLQFDVSDIVYETVYDDDDVPVQSASSWLGITMGRDELDSQYHGGDGGGAYTIFFDNNPWNGGDGSVAGRAYMMRAGSGPVDSDITYNFKNAWSKESQNRGAVTLRVRAVNGSVALYVRYADEPLSKLDEPVKVFDNVETNGYIALCCTMAASYKIDNFRITNLDQGANVPEPVKETGIEVNTSDVEKTLLNGATLDLGNMKVYALYSDGTRKLLSANEYSVDNGGFDAAKSGEYAIKVTYGAFDAVTFKVKVVEEVKPEKGCGSSIISVSAAAAIAGAGVLTLGILLLRKQKKS